jgi:hypothetical protein
MEDNEDWADNALPKIRQAQDYFVQALEALENEDDLDARHVTWWKRPSYRFTMWRVRRSMRRMAEELEDVEAVTRHTGGYDVRLSRPQAMRLRRKGRLGQEGETVSGGHNLATTTALSDRREGRLCWSEGCPRQESNLRLAV